MSEAKQSDSTAELGDSLPTTPYGLMYEAEPGPEDEGWIEYLDEPGYTAAQMRLHAKQAAFKERLRWLEVAKAVVESHDAALAYVYERLRAQGVGSITIPDAAVAEIRAVNALRELVSPNTPDDRR
jgi:hypothetical protein